MLTRSSFRSTASAGGFATTTCSRICCGWSSAGRCPKRCRRCTGGPPPGSSGLARGAAPSGPRQGQGDWPRAPRGLPALCFAGRWGGRRTASRGLADAERHLLEGAVLARQIGRPYLEARCLAQLGFASKIRPFATVRRRCREAIALAERHGWCAEPWIAPALVTLAEVMAWAGEFDEGQGGLHPPPPALPTHTPPDTT